MYGARPNAICYVCGEGVVERFIYTLLILVRAIENCYLYVALALPVQMTV